MKQFNTPYKSIIAIVLLFSCVNAFAQPGSYYPDRYVRNWRLFNQDNYATNYQTTFSVNNKIYHLIQDSTYYDATIGGFVAFYFPRLKSFDVATNQWSMMADFPAVGRSSGVSFTIDDNAYFGLGVNRVTYQTADSAFYKYNAVTNTWSSIAAFPSSSLYNAISFSLNGKGYVVAGQQISPTTQESQKTFEYNPISNTWSTFDDIPATGGILVFSNNQVFTHNNKAYISYISNTGNELWEFDPTAATGSQWTQKTPAPNNYYLNFYSYGLFETKKGCLIMGGNVEYYDTASNYVSKFNDTAYSYDAANDMWQQNYCSNQFQNINKAFTINNEAFVFSANNSNGLNLGYNEQAQYSFYYINAYASTPLDTVFVHHNFKGVCENSTPTVAYNVSTAMNAGNQFVFVITREDGLILDTVAIASGTTSGSQQINIPSITALKNKALQLGLGNYGIDFGKLKLAVLTTNPRTIFANQSTTFSLFDDPANLSISISGLNSDVCSNVAPLGLKFNGLNNYNFQGFLNIPKSDLSINWANGNGVNIPTNDTTDILYANDSTLNYIEATLRIDYKLFCNNHDTTYSYDGNTSISRYTNNTLLADISAQEGNSLCGNNETKHIITKLLQENVDSCWGYRKLFKNGVKFYDDSIMMYRNYFYPGYEDGFTKDTFTLAGINDNDEIELQFTSQADKCDANSKGTLIRKLIFKKYQGSLSSDINLKLRFNNNLTDSSTNNNNGIGQNIGFTTNRFGKPNSALQILLNTSPTNASEVVTTNNINIDSNKNRTVSFWFKTDSLGYNYGGENSSFSPSRPAILGWGSFVTGSDANFFHIEPKTKSVVFRGNYNDLFTDSNIFKFNEWTHVALTLNDNFVNLYVNGKCAKSVSFKSLYQYSYTDSAYSSTGNGFTYSWLNSTLNTTNSPLRIGNDGNGIDLASDWKFPFHGGVDDILIYSKAMTTCQIDSLYRMTESGCTTTLHTINASICSGNSYFFKGINRTTTDTYKDTLINANGCDSIVTLNLLVKQKSFTSIDTAVCNGYMFKGIVRTISNTYRDTLMNTNGCDSFITVHLIIKQKSATTINAGVCAGDAYTFQGNNLAVAGTYQVILINAVGCDSIVTLNLKVNAASDTTLYRAICAGQSLSIFGETYTTAGTHHFTRTNAADCDSNITLIVTVNQPTSSLKRDTICNTQLPYLWNGISRTAAGTFTKNFTNAVGCDSVATLILTVKQATSSTTKDSIYAGNSYSFSGNTYTTAGTYTVHLLNSVKCDSAATLILIVKSSIAATITGNLVGCSFVLTNSLSASIGGGNWRSSNQAVAKINEFGVVTNIANGTTTITYTYYKSGQPIISTITYTVAVMPALNPITGVASFCRNASTTFANSTSIPVGGSSVWSTTSSSLISINATTGVANGVYQGTGYIQYKVTNSSGCSNVTGYSITIKPIPNLPTVQYAAGTVNPQTGPNGSFCTNKIFTVVGNPVSGVWSSTGVISIGATTGILNTGSIAGAASVIYTISVNGCINSKIVDITVAVCPSHRGSNTEEMMNSSNEFTVYPNPAKGMVNLQVNKLIGAGSIVITDLYGKQVKIQALSIGNNGVDISNLSKGFYLISIITSEGKTTKKLVVE